jgi:hypothetical protein
VAGDDEVDARVEVLRDVDDRAGQAAATGLAPEGERRAGRRQAALVQQHDDRLDPRAAQVAGGEVRRRDLVLELDVLDPRLGHELRRALEGHADEADRDAVDDLDLGRRQDRAAGRRDLAPPAVLRVAGHARRPDAGLVPDVGREPVEARAG